jgi:hypothetical protein
MQEDGCPLFFARVTLIGCWIPSRPTGLQSICFVRFPSDEMEPSEVSKDVGNVKNNSADLDDHLRQELNASFVF